MDAFMTLLSVRAELDHLQESHPKLARLSPQHLDRSLCTSFAPHMPYLLDLIEDRLKSLSKNTKQLESLYNSLNTSK